MIYKEVMRIAGMLVSGSLSGYCQVLCNWCSIVHECGVAGAVAEQNRQDTALASLLTSSHKLTGQDQKIVQQKVELEA